LFRIGKGKGGGRTVVVAALMTVLSCTMSARAGFTTVSTSTNRGELGHADILAGVYGGSFSASGVNFTNGSITAVRVHDFDSGDGQSGTLNLLSGSLDGINDQVWHDGVSLMGVRTRYGSYGTTLGVYQGSDQPDTGFTGSSLLSTGDNPFVGTGMTYGSTTLTGDWRWGTGGDGNYSSLMDDNDGVDHMVTYMITGEGLAALGYAADATVWLLFWDKGDETGFDRDFNDYVAEVVALGVAIPIPTPVAMAAVGLCGILLVRKRFARSLT